LESSTFFAVALHEIATPNTEPEHAEDPEVTTSAQAGQTFKTLLLPASLPELSLSFVLVDDFHIAVPIFCCSQFAAPNSHMIFALPVLNSCAG